MAVANGYEGFLRSGFGLDWVDEFKEVLPISPSQMQDTPYIILVTGPLE